MPTPTLSHRGLSYHEAESRVLLRKESLGQHLIPLKNYYRSPCKAFGTGDDEFYPQIKFLSSSPFSEFLLLQDYGRYWRYMINKIGFEYS